MIAYKITCFYRLTPDGESFCNIESVFIDTTKQRKKIKTPELRPVTTEDD